MWQRYIIFYENLMTRLVVRYAAKWMVVSDDGAHNR